MTTKNPRRWWILGALCLSLLVLTIDNMILTLAIPALMSDLGASPASVQWILDAYILVFAGALLTAGSMSDRFGRRRFLNIGLSILGVASLLAAFAEEPWQVVACRAVMGLGAAIAMPSTLSILINVFEDDERRKAMSIWGMVSMLGIVLGPAAGGLLLEHFGWASAFLINVPLAIIGIISAVILIPESKGPARPSDPVGAVLSVAGMAALVFALIQIPHEGWSNRVVAAAVAAVVILAVFVVWELKREYPMLPLGIFRSRDFTGASLACVLIVFTNGAVMLALTQYLQLVLGFSPMTSALAFAPMAVVVGIVNPLAATVGKHISNKTLTVVGLLVIAGSFVILSMTGPEDGYGWLILGLVTVGVGTGLTTPAVYATLTSAIPPEHAGVGSAVNDTIQQGGMALGVAALGSVLSSAYTDALPSDVPEAARGSLTDALALAERTGATDLVRVARDAFLESQSTVFTVAAAMSVLGAVFALIVLRRKTSGPVEEASAEAELETSQV
ncbi:MFS transporter [Stackebrandtia nassauensis]|uniref:Major facilitator superfamily MFS_1 n=1 Tax=Stackebrandtia nassauensis (strain DSM 44728 / CIP 108903 / NRRL B-16338 / NBRC 102104 / LLR-40K-21) TaxID=446470 RepID=D3PX73_STANL|nr:MFS transporter [Stackebrandtia nassauensis]ADD41336.1 major facilitator superfamily MFS_1 [Stackebrandtia nassauensis DSM 44728]